jgi:glycosyltransferase involved in cell wall biosynthesis
MKVIISIPAYNEEKTLGPVVKEISRVMDATDYQYKVVVVNDGSTDKTAEVAKAHGALVFSHPRNYGLAEAFRTEIEKALELNFDVFVHTDADGQYRAEDIPRLIKEVENGYDLVLGNRFEGGIEEMPLMKRIGNKAFSRAISNIIRFHVGDCQTGFRAFTREVAEKILISSTFTYTQEQIIRAVKMKFRIKEIPTKFLKRGGKTSSRLMRGPFDYAIKAWINIMRIYRDYEPLKFFGWIGSIFLGVGAGVGFWLLYLFVTTGAIRRIPTAILAMMFILIGIQIILFGFLADMRKNER